MKIYSKTHSIQTVSFLVWDKNMKLLIFFSSTYDSQLIKLDFILCCLDSLKCHRVLVGSFKNSAFGGFNTSAAIFLENSSNLDFISTEIPTQLPKFHKSIFHFSILNKKFQIKEQWNMTLLEVKINLNDKIKHLTEPH